MIAHEKWLASFASESTSRLYEKVFGMFWEWSLSEGRYSPPANADPYEWLMKHRHDEVKKHSPDPLHCERIVRDWLASLSESDLDPSSQERYRAVLHAIFTRLIPRRRGSLDLRLLEPDEHKP